MTRSSFAAFAIVALALAAPPPASAQKSDTVTLRVVDSVPAPTIERNAFAVTKSVAVSTLNVGLRLTTGAFNLIARAGHSTAKAIDATGCDQLPLTASCKSYVDREIADAQARAARQRTSTAVSTLKDTTSSTPDPHSRK